MPPCLCIRIAGVRSTEQSVAYTITKEELFENVDRPACREARERDIL